MEAQLTTRVSSDDELARWIAGGHLRGTDSLICWDGGVTDAGARTLAACPDARGLASLDLSWNRIGSAGARALMQLPAMARLRLYHNDVGADGAAQIAASGAHLAMLNLCGNALGDDGVHALARGELHALDELALGWNGITAVEALLAGPWHRLAKLNVRANQLRAHHAAALLAGLPALRWLGLDENPLGEIAPLVAAPGFHRLEWLNLGGTELDDRAADSLAAAGPCALRELRLHDNDLSPDAIARIRVALPRCEVSA